MNHVMPWYQKWFWMLDAKEKAGQTKEHRACH